MSTYTDRDSVDDSVDIRNDPSRILSPPYLVTGAAIFGAIVIGALTYKAFSSNSQEDSHISPSGLTDLLVK